MIDGVYLTIHFLSIATTLFFKTCKCLFEYTNQLIFFKFNFISTNLLINLDISILMITNITDNDNSHVIQHLNVLIFDKATPIFFPKFFSKKGQGNDTPLCRSLLIFV